MHAIVLALPLAILLGGREVAGATCLASAGPLHDEASDSGAAPPFAFPCPDEPFVDLSTTPEYQQQLNVTVGWYKPSTGRTWSREACPVPPALPAPPLVAHCIAGMARSFSEPTVHRSLKANLINAIGGRAVVFLSLKTFDVSGERRAQTAIRGRPPDSRRALTDHPSPTTPRRPPLTTRFVTASQTGRYVHR